MTTVALLLHLLGRLPYCLLLIAFQFSMQLSNDPHALGHFLIYV